MGHQLPLDLELEATIDREDQVRARARGNQPLSARRDGAAVDARFGHQLAGFTGQQLVVFELQPADPILFGVDRTQHRSGQLATVRVEPFDVVEQVDAVEIERHDLLTQPRVDRASEVLEAGPAGELDPEFGGGHPQQRRKRLCGALGIGDQTGVGENARLGGRHGKFGARPIEDPPSAARKLHDVLTLLAAQRHVLVWRHQLQVGQPHDEPPRGHCQRDEDQDHTKTGVVRVESRRRRGVTGGPPGSRHRSVAGGSPRRRGRVRSCPGRLRRR